MKLEVPVWSLCANFGLKGVSNFTNLNICAKVGLCINQLREYG